jgi:Holliday junction DNA helicase RuvA
VIGSLRGEVIERDADSRVLFEVAGVGYLVTVTPATLAALKPGSTALLYVHHHIREDAHTLFGFVSRYECTSFRVLIGTHGVGPALALAILATHSPGALVDIVAGSDIAALTLVPGVGKKTAERLIVELRSRLSLPIMEMAAANGPVPNERRGSPVTDVRDALLGLGYAHEEIRDALRGLDGSGDSATLLREALSLLAARRA